MCSWDLYIYFVIAVLMVLPFLYEYNNQVGYYLKFSIYYFFVMLCSVLCIPFIAWRPGNVRNTLIATLPLRILNPLLGLNWEIEGIEHILPDRAVVVVANHQSSIDFLGMVHMWPIFCKISAIAKKEIFYAMPFGFTAWLCGTRFIDRSNPQRAKESMNAALNYCKDNKVKLWIFPEGTRNMKAEMLSFKKGAFHLAISGQLPVLPIVYSSYTGFLNPRLKIFNPGNIVVTCLPPVETKGMTMDDMPELMDTVRAQMMETFTRISPLVKQPFPFTEEQRRQES